MWRPPINFITLHYAWIIFAGLLGLIVLFPAGNLAAVDAYFFGASASTESGLNTIDVKELFLYQQLYIYFIPIVTNLGVINIAVVVVRLYWFKKKLGAAAKEARLHLQGSDIEVGVPEPLEKSVQAETTSTGDTTQALPDSATTTALDPSSRARLNFSPDVKDADPDSKLYIPSPRARDAGVSFGVRDADTMSNEDEDQITKATTTPSGLERRRPYHQAEDGSNMLAMGTRSVTHMVESMFVLGPSTDRRSRSMSVSRQPPPSSANLPGLTRQVTIGRNSRFHNLTPLDRERLGGIEYRSLKLLLKILIGYYCGLHLLGVISLIPWIHTAPAKYGEYLASQGVDKTWWAIYSTQTMINNLGFTLTSDSMVSFNDATWPLLIMTFLAFAGNTLYPVFLRLVIWTMSKTVPAKSRLREPLQFLLDHPRRCYTLLFPSKLTWILFGIIFSLNFVDVLFIIVLDLENPVVTALPPGPRVLASLFQAASARHTGTSTFNLAEVNPAVQFSLLVMMYVAILPISISIRASNTYEERALGIYESGAHELDENNSATYVTSHVRNQLSFDLWYIFLGTFLVCIAEAARIRDVEEPAFAVFPVFFEVMSAYANVGLSLGHPSVATSLAGQFKTISKLIICAMMIRGRHRGLPNSIDKAIMLPADQATAAADATIDEEQTRRSRSSVRRSKK